MEYTWLPSSGFKPSPEAIIHEEEVVGDSEMAIDSTIHSSTDAYAEDDAESCCCDCDYGYDYEDRSWAADEDIGHSVEDVRMLMMKKPAADPELDRMFWETCLDTGLPMN